MGLIKKLFGGLFALIAGLLGGLAKLFGLGKKSEFYLELADSGEAQATRPSLATDAQAPSSPSAATAESASQAAATPSTSAATSTETSSAAQKGAVASPSLNPDQPLVTARPQVASQADDQGLKTFATDYLVNPRVNLSSRRRPGPSISPFKEMAQQLGKQSPSLG